MSLLANVLSFGAKCFVKTMAIWNMAEISPCCSLLAHNLVSIVYLLSKVYNYKQLHMSPLKIFSSYFFSLVFIYHLISLCGFVEYAPWITVRLHWSSGPNEGRMPIESTTYCMYLCILTTKGTFSLRFAPSLTHIGSCLSLIRCHMPRFQFKWIPRMPNPASYY